MVMDLVSVGYSTEKLALNVNVINDRVLQCYNYLTNSRSTFADNNNHNSNTDEQINHDYHTLQNTEDDLITLQAMTLLSLVAHISGLHELSTQCRNYCRNIIFDLEIQDIDNKKNTVINSNHGGGDELSAGLNEVAGVMTPLSSTTDSTLGQVHKFHRYHSSKIFQSSRVKTIPSSSLLDNARRCFWEFYFFDVIIGSADGRTLSKLATIPQIHINYPISPSRHSFDYRSRAMAADLVSNAVRQNLAITGKKPFVHILTLLTVQLENMNMRLTDPKPMIRSKSKNINGNSNGSGMTRVEQEGEPLLVNAQGIVNEGVHQAVLLFNYARIFAHRPFSFLWRITIPNQRNQIKQRSNNNQHQFRKVNSPETQPQPDLNPELEETNIQSKVKALQSKTKTNKKILPQNPKCAPSANLLDRDQAYLSSLPEEKIYSRKLIETRKTIEAADAIVQVLMDTGAARILQRSPLFACSLALLALVHISAYVWIEEMMTINAENSAEGGGNEDNDNNFTIDDLQLYSEYIKLSMNGLTKISEHWLLSRKLAKHLKDTVKQIPTLFNQMKEVVSLFEKEEVDLAVRSEGELQDREVQQLGTGELNKFNVAEEDGNNGIANKNNDNGSSPINGNDRCVYDNSNSIPPLLTESNSQQKRSSSPQPQSHNQEQQQIPFQDSTLLPSDNKNSASTPFNTLLNVDVDIISDKRNHIQDISFNPNDSNVNFHINNSDSGNVENDNWQNIISNQFPATTKSTKSTTAMTEDAPEPFEPAGLDDSYYQYQYQYQNQNQDQDQTQFFPYSDESLSPMLDTGCNWIDKMLGETTITGAAEGNINFEELYNDGGVNEM